LREAFLKVADLILDTEALAADKALKTLSDYQGLLPDSYHSMRQV